MRPGDPPAYSGVMVPRLGPLPPDADLPRDCAVGRIIRVADGIADVRSRAGLVRATYGAEYLARIAHDPRTRPRPGDLVLLRTWPGPRVTMEPLDRRDGGGRGSGPAMRVG